MHIPILDPEWLVAIIKRDGLGQLMFMLGVHIRRVFRLIVLLPPKKSWRKRSRRKTEGGTHGAMKHVVSYVGSTFFGLRVLVSRFLTSPSNIKEIEDTIIDVEDSDETEVLLF